MKKFLLSVLIFLPVSITGAMDGTSNHHPERILITFAAGSQVSAEIQAFRKTASNGMYDVITTDRSDASAHVASFLSDHGLKSLRSMVRSSRNNKTVPDATAARNRMFIGTVEDPARFDIILNQLQSHPDITFAEPDFIGHGGGKMTPHGSGQKFQTLPQKHVATYVTSFPDDRLFGLQWGLENTGQAISEINGVAGEDINIRPAWNITTGSDEITVAILDSGLPLVVPDLAGRVVPGYNFVSDTTWTDDDHAHGTGVTSIGFATGNNSGTMAGIDWNAKIMPVKVLNDENFGFYSWWVNGIYWAVDNGADVINMSLGGSDFSNSLEQAVTDAIASGVHVVACMMNTNSNQPFIPAAFDGVIAVGAINNQGERAAPFSWGGGSNYGSHINLVAPGDRIIGLLRSNTEAAGYWSGTSMAAPMVAGVVSLMLSVNPDLDPADVEKILSETSRGDGNWNQYMGWGVLDAHAAVTSALEMQETGIAEDLPHAVLLGQNYPNPFNPATLIAYEIPDQSHVTVSVYSVDGRRVAVLVDGIQPAGRHSVPFDATGLGSGVYLYEMTAAGQRLVRRMTLVK